MYFLKYNTRVPLSNMHFAVKQHEEQIKGDLCEHFLDFDDSKNFWKTVNKMHCSKVANTVSSINGIKSARNIANAWKGNLENIYNSIIDNNSRDIFYNRSVADSKSSLNLHVADVSDAISKQKKGKAAGPNGLLMESYFFDCKLLFTHTALFFNFCIRHCYFPDAFVNFVIVPLIKNKNGNTADMNNYRAIALLNILTKVFTLLGHLIG